MTTLDRRKKVFISHASQDFALVEKYVINVLEQEFKLPCVVDCRDFKGGKLSTVNIIDAVQQCFKTVVVLTKHSLKSSWVKYETLLALEKSQKTRRLALTILLLDVELKDTALFGILSHAMVVKLDLNRSDWKQQMYDKVLEVSSVEKVLPTGNLAAGQVWSHFTGFSRVVLPELATRIVNSPWYQPDAFPIALFELIPSSCKTHAKLQEVDDRIHYVGDLETVLVDRGTYRKRPYQIPVFSIYDEVGKKYFFSAEFPNTLSILHKLEKETKELLNLKNGLSGSPLLTEGERCLQTERYYFTLNRLINHPRSRKCNNMAVLLRYDDSREKLGDVLIRAIKKECMACFSGMRPKGMSSSKTISRPNSYEADRDLKRRTVCVISGDSEQDRSLCEEVKGCLLSCEFLIWEGERPGISHLQVMENALNEANWLVLVLTKDFLKSSEFPIVNWKCRMALHQSIEENQLRVIPILDGITEKDLPDELGWVTYISTSDPRFSERLMQTLQSENITMECSVPAVDVATGLAWAYVINYLCITLRAHMDKMREFQQAHPDLTVYQKLLILVPSSCTMRRSLDKDENGSLLDPRFEERENCLFDHKMAVSGIINRKYQLKLYSLKASSKEFVLAVEYPNSVLCLQEMAEIPYLSGLHQENLHHEAWRFKRIAEEALKQTKVADLAKLLYYDDTRLRVPDVLIHFLQSEGL